MLVLSDAGSSNSLSPTHRGRYGFRGNQDREFSVGGPSAKIETPRRLKI
jgi:hypothetical protein